MVRPLQASYYEERNSKIEKGMGAVNKAERKKAWNEYYNWVKDNHNIVDMRKLFTVNKGGTYTYKADPTYLTKLKTIFGEQFDEIIAQQKKEIEAYNDRLELKDASLQGDPTAAFELARWKLRYDPAIYLRNVLDNDFQRNYVGGNYVKNEGQEFVVKRAKDKWIDSKYQTITSDEDLKAYYNFAVKTLNNLYKFIPPSYKNGVLLKSIMKKEWQLLLLKLIQNL
jgi:hypothetical protein